MKPQLKTLITTLSDQHCNTTRYNTPLNRNRLYIIVNLGLHQKSLKTKFHRFKCGFVKCGYLSYGSTSCQVNYCRKSMGASQTFRESKFHDKIQSSRANMFAIYRETVWGALNQSVTMEMASWQ